MTSFEDRKKALENKYAQDQETLFKLEARTSKLFGLWAAERMGIASPEAEKYAGEVVAANLHEPGMDDIKRKVRADFAAKSIDIDDMALETALLQAGEEAEKQMSER